MDILAKIFGNEGRVKLLRFMVLSGDKQFIISEIERQTNLSEKVIRKEISYLKKSDLLEVKSIFVEVETKRKTKKVRTLSVKLNRKFKYLEAVKNLFISTNPLSTQAMVKRFNQIGRVKLVVTSGIFLENPDSRLDLLVVGDRLDKSALDRAVRSFEMSLGRELRYTSLDTSEFNYRVSILDRLVRDVFDYPHQKIVNKIGV